MRLLKHGSKIGNATVIVDIIPSGNPEIRPGRKMVAKYLTDHDTGNSGRDADAEMHNRYIHNMANYHPRDTSHVSWHLSVDENFIYQHIPFDEIAWHCGDGTGPGNYSSVGIEKCMHSNGDRNKIEANGIALHAYLMKALNIPIQNVKPHQHWSGKYCPQLILNKYGSFLPFRNKIEAAFKGGVSAPAPKPAPTESIVDYLNARGKDSSFNARAKIAATYGIPNYRGTALQNTQLLQLIKADKPSTVKPKPVTPVSKPKEDDDMLKQAIVIGSLNDYASAEILSIRRGIPIFPRNAIKGEVARELIVVGGNTKGLKADKITNLSGKDRFDTAKNVEKYL